MMRARPKRYILIAQGIAIGILVAIYLISSSVWAQHPSNSDFPKFYMSARFVWEHEGIYTPIPAGSFGKFLEHARATQEILHPNLNPPFQTLLFAPLGLLDYRMAYRFWSVVSLLCGIAAACMSGRALQKSERRYFERVFGHLLLLLAYFPTWVTVMYGQLSLLVFLLLAIIWMSARSQQDWLAGIALGLVMNLKVFTGLFLVLFVVRHRWRLLAWWVGTVIGCNLVASVVLGFGVYQQYLSALGGVTWYAASWNASLMGFFARIFGGSGNVPLIDIPGLAPVIAYGLSGLMVAGIIWLNWPSANDARLTEFDLNFGLILVAMLLISPLGWMYYFPLLLIPVLTIWHVTANAPFARRYRVTIVLVWLLSTVPHKLITATEMNGPLNGFIWGGVYVYALLILGGVLVALIYALRRGSRLAPLAKGLAI